MDKKEAFVVAWNTADPGIPIDTSGCQIFGQQFDGSGMKLGSSFQVNTYTIGASYDAAIAMTGSILTLGTEEICR